MTIESEDDLLALSRIGAIVAEVRDSMASEARPSVNTAELDEIAASILKRHGARSAPKLAYGFPGHTCISVNDELAHGIPSRRKVLREGDLVNIDVSAELDGYWADTGATYAVGNVSPRLRKLCDATRHALDDAMRVAKAGAPLFAIGRAVEHRARRSGLRVVRNLAGHGVGRFIHESPSVSNVYDRRDHAPLWEGLVITIEPFLTTGATRVIEADDGWTLKTPDRSLGAQYEHTMVITKGDPLVLTRAAG